MTNYNAEDFFGLKKRHHKTHNLMKDIPMITENKQIEYWSESAEKWMPLYDMHHDHLLNLIVKLVSKDYDGKFKVITETREINKKEDEYIVTSFIK